MDRHAPVASGLSIALVVLDRPGKLTHGVAVRGVIVVMLAYAAWVARSTRRRARSAQI